MDKNTEKRALAALARQQREAKYRNEWMKNNRERVAILFPLGTRERITALGEKSVNSYINRLVAEDLARREGQ